MECPNCNRYLKPGVQFCGYCGTRLIQQQTTPESSQPDRDPDPIDLGQSSTVQEDSFVPIDPDDYVIDTSDSTDAGASSFGTGFETSSITADGFNQQETSHETAISSVQTNTSVRPQKSVETKRSARQSTMSSNDLWTWLKKDDRRQLFFIEEREPLSEDQYMSLVSQKLQENQVPAAIRKKTIRWDNSNITGEMYYIDPNTTSINPLTCVLQFSQVGRFSFVEQKTFLAPPDLPEMPGKKKTLPSDMAEKAKMVLYGAGLFLVGIILISMIPVVGIILMVAGGFCAYSGWSAFQSRKEIEEWNAKCDAQEAKYEKAWSDWEDTVFLHSFQESTNGKISRIYQSVFECMRQVNAEQFKDAASTDEREDTSLLELRQQVSQRKDSYR